MAAVAGPQTPRTEGDRPASAGAVVPFRRATTRRTAIIEQDAGTISTSTQNIQITVEGTGYMTAIILEITATTATNSATVAYQADAPWCAFDSIVLSDNTGETINLTGYDLFLLNKWGGWYTHATLDSATSDTNIYSLTSGSGGTGGSFKFILKVPVAVNNRNFLGLLGNQDRALKYQLRDDIAASTSIYSTAPSNLPTFTINRYYESVTVPGGMNADGVAQERQPPKFGVQHFGTRIIAESPPAGGSTVNHYLRRLNNTIRTLILVFRSNGSRATAETYMPTRITFLLGDMTIFTESTALRRWYMRQRFGFDADAGVLVYDFINDLLGESGAEFGLDYLWTGGIVNAQFQITYPSGFGSTANSLVILTSDLIVPDTINLYAPDGA